MRPYLIAGALSLAVIALTLAGGAGLGAMRDYLGWRPADIGRAAQCASILKCGVGP